ESLEVGGVRRVGSRLRDFLRRDVRLGRTGKIRSGGGGSRLGFRVQIRDLGRRGGGCRCGIGWRGRRCGFRRRRRSEIRSFGRSRSRGWFFLRSFRVEVGGSWRRCSWSRSGRRFGGGCGGWRWSRADSRIGELLLERLVLLLETFQIREVVFDDGVFGELRLELFHAFAERSRFIRSTR